MSMDLPQKLGVALDRSDHNEAIFLILDFRTRCGFTRTQQRMLFDAYRVMFAWSIEHKVTLPGSLVDTDMDSIEGQIINQALVELVICSAGSGNNDALAELCAQMCRGIMRHGKPMSEVVQRWQQQGIPPLLLARSEFFHHVRDHHFAVDLGL